MIFKIVLTVLFFLVTLSNILAIDEPREPLTKELVMLNFALNCLLVYGIWNWI